MPEDQDFEDSLTELDNIGSFDSEKGKDESAFEVEETTNIDPTNNDSKDDPEDSPPEKKNKVLSIKVPDIEIDQKADVLTAAYAAECIKIVNAIPDVWKQIDETLFGLNKNLDHIERQLKIRETAIRKQIHDEKDAEKKKVFNNDKQRDHAFYTRTRSDKEWNRLIENKEDFRYKVKEFQRQQGRLEHIFKAKRITLRYLSKGGQ